MADTLYKLFVTQFTYRGDNIGGDLSVKVEPGLEAAKTLRPRKAGGARMKPGDSVTFDFELVLRKSSDAANVRVPVKVTIIEADAIGDEGSASKELTINLGGPNSQPFMVDVDLPGRGGDARKTGKFSLKLIAEVVTDPCSALFEEMDHETHPPDVRARTDLTAAAKETRIKAVVDTLHVIEAREQRRYDDASNRRVPRTDVLQPHTLSRANREGAVAAIRTISGLLLGQFRKYCGTGGSVEFDKLWACFAAFAAGKLRIAGRPSSREPDRGDPNSPVPFFRFAELATVCIELGIDAAEWTTCLKVMVGTQEIFLKAYPDLDPEGRIDAVPAATVEALKVKHKAMNQVDELLKAFRDNDRAIPRQLALQSVSGYLCAEGGGGREVIANRAALGPWEKFSVAYSGDEKISLQAANGQFVCAEGGGGREVVANRAAIGPWEKFSVVYLGGGKVALRAANGQFVCAEQSSPIRQVVANRSAIGPWEMFVRVLN